MLPDIDNNHILILEDEPVIGKILKRALTADGYRVEIAENGLIAKEKISSGSRYDAVVLDIRTPVISGIQLYEYLEKQHPGLAEKVIFATGDYLNPATGRFLEHVRRPFLAKPYTPAQIKGMIQQVIAGSRPADEG